MKPFENPSNPSGAAAGITYKRAAWLAGGLGLAAWYLAARRDTRKSPAEDFIGDSIRPKSGGDDRGHKR